MEFWQFILQNLFDRFLVVLKGVITVVIVKELFPSTPSLDINPPLLVIVIYY